MNLPGELPTYTYRPETQVDDQPQVRTHSGRRARFTDDTYFRATEPGQLGNLISIHATEPDDKNAGFFYVTNHQVRELEMVTSSKPISFAFLDVGNLEFNESITLEFITSQTHRTFYSISLQIRARPIQITRTDLGIRTLGDTVVTPNGSSFRILPEHTQASPGDTVTISGRVQKYPLKWVKVSTTGSDGTTTEFNGWDIEELRAKVENNPNSWIEMMPRSFKDKAPVQIPPYDAQDEDEDSPVMDPFSAYLSGGDGLPDEPDGQKTGPSRSIVHLNYGELHNGTMGLVNVIYEWRGASNVDGEWVNLFTA